MFKYYIQVFEDDKRQPQVTTTPSDTLLLATSRSNSVPPHSYQHFSMLREDYEGLFYRKLNTIIELQQLEQLFSQNEVLFGNLSNTFMQQLMPKSGCSSRRKGDSEVQYQNAVLELSKEMISYHSRMRRQCQLVHKKVQLQVYIDKLMIDKRGLIEQIRIFAQKMGELIRQNFKNESCRAMENLLIQQCKKYNISKVIVNFMSQLKEAIVSSWVIQSVGMLLRKSADDVKGVTKLQELRLLFNGQKNKKQLVSNLTLYLKEFYSSTVYKELSELIVNLIKIYEFSRGEDNLFMMKLMESISQNFVLLERIGRLLVVKNGQLMDYKIDIQILNEEGKLVEKRIKIAEQTMLQYIQEETVQLVSQYQSQLPCSTELHEVNESNSYQYFYSTLTNRYKEFIMGHLKLAEQIQNLKQKIEHYNFTLSSYEEQLNYRHNSRSQLQTHRTVIFQERQNSFQNFDKNEYNQGEQLQSFIKHQQQHQIHYQQTKDRTNMDTSNNLELLQLNGSQYQNNLFIGNYTHQNSNKQIKFNGHEQQQQKQVLQTCIQQVNHNSPSNRQKKSPQSINQMARRMTTLLKHLQRKEKFIAKKSLRIGIKNNSVKNSNKYLDNKEYQIKITKKFLIMQPITDQILSICQKIELSQIKNYHPNYQNASLKVDYSGCSLHLHFLTFNFDIFIKKLENALKISNLQKKVGQQVKENNFPFSNARRDLVK